MSDVRETIAAILDVAGNAISTLASALPPEARAAVIVGAGIATLAASLVRSLGVGTAHKVLEELHRRVEAGEGVITDADIAEDDAAIDALLADLFGPVAERA